MASDLFSLEGRVALVTGGSRGIGKMIAKGFIDQGAKVYISSRKPAACDATAAELGPNCISMPQDVSTGGGREGAGRAADRRPNRNWTSS
jgi:2-deoxy-D-gluconate 3-dehydrogenase